MDQGFGFSKQHFDCLSWDVHSNSCSPCGGLVTISPFAWNVRSGVLSVEEVEKSLQCRQVRYIQSTFYCDVILRGLFAPEFDGVGQHF